MLSYVDNLNRREGKRTKKESRERRTQKTTECVPVAPPSPRPVSSCVWVPSRPVAPVVVLYFVLHPKGDDCRRRRARRKIKENVDTDLPEESSWSPRCVSFCQLGWCWLLISTIWNCFLNWKAKSRKSIVLTFSINVFKMFLLNICAAACASLLKIPDFPEPA